MIYIFYFLSHQLVLALMAPSITPTPPPITVPAIGKIADPTEAPSVPPAAAPPLATVSFEILWMMSKYASCCVIS